MRIASPGPAAALGAAVALALSLSLAACAPDPAPITLPPQPTSTPLFASDEEALAAAEEVYAAYVAALDELGHRGWDDPSVLEEVAAGSVLENDQARAVAYEADGIRQVGTARFAIDALQTYSAFPPIEIAFYVCLDVTDIDLVDADGDSVVSSDRADVVALEVAVTGESLNALRVERSELWSGASYC
jgi:hypothetical protein